MSKVRKYWRLERFEKTGLVLTVLALSFIFSFRAWGVDSFDALLGFKNLILNIFFVASAFLVHEIAHRTIATWMGYRSQYKSWLVGLVIGIVVVFISNGRLFFLATGMLVITHLPAHRLGKFFYELNMKHLGWIAMSGPIANMLFAVLLKIIYASTGIVLFHQAMMINIWIALFDMLPVPPFNGSKTFFGSRYIYVFTLAALAGCAALLTFASGILPIIGALVVGALVVTVFFIYIDKNW
ncbi:hypothetical protein HQ545_00220 [Candidatus Woesearchaeota archaeon]|nr:hypothetical protein [Candidatus Woesearchaeota archaeon]